LERAPPGRGAGYTFARFGEELDEGLSNELRSGEQRPEQSLLLEEVKIGCTLGMLSCLDRPHRLAYILGEVLDMDGEERRHPRNRAGDVPQEAAASPRGRWSHRDHP
jgi:hypothetical protein